MLYSWNIINSNAFKHVLKLILKLFNGILTLNVLKQKVQERDFVNPGRYLVDFIEKFVKFRIKRLNFLNFIKNFKRHQI